MEIPVYRLLGYSYVLNYFNVELPPRLNASDFELTAGIIAKARDLFHERFDSDNFYVVYLPGGGYGDQLLPQLRARGLNVLDYSRDRWSEGMSLDGDGHPSATGHKEIARRVARDILQETTRVEASQ